MSILIINEGVDIFYQTFIWFEPKLSNLTLVVEHFGFLVFNFSLFLHNAFLSTIILGMKSLTLPFKKIKQKCIN